jgi:hypothetical protein
MNTATTDRQHQDASLQIILEAVIRLDGHVAALVSEVKGLRQDRDRDRDRADLATRLAANDAERSVLQQQRDELVVSRIEAAFGRQNFSASEVWERPDLCTQFQQWGITSARHLGKFLQRVHGQPCGPLCVERIGRDHQSGAIWIVVPTVPSGIAR